MTVFVQLLPGFYAKVICVAVKLPVDFYVTCKVSPLAPTVALQLLPKAQQMMSGWLLGGAQKTSIP